jgi:hypothetical protein
MKNIEDVRGTKAARNILGKHGIDISQADVRVEGGKCSIRGLLQVMKGYEREVTDVEKTVLHLCSIMKRKPEIRDVILEASFRNAAT